jgi:hypothetical protein
MFGSWFAKAFLAFLLTFAIAGFAHGQTKSADLPVQQRISCAPAIALAPGQMADLTAAESWTPVSLTEWNDSWSDLRMELNTLAGYFSELVLYWRSIRGQVLAMTDYE